MFHNLCLIVRRSCWVKREIWTSSWTWYNRFSCFEPCWGEIVGRSVCQLEGSLFLRFQLCGQNWNIIYTNHYNRDEDVFTLVFVADDCYDIYLMIRKKISIFRCFWGDIPSHSYKAKRNLYEVGGHPYDTHRKWLSIWGLISYHIIRLQTSSQVLLQNSRGRWTTLPKTNSSPLKIGRNPKGK